jgi:protein dispatched 1
MGIRAPISGQPTFQEAESMTEAVLEIVDEVNANAPESAGKLIVASPWLFYDYVLNVELKHTLFSGLLGIAPLCFGMLLSTSWNWLTSFLAIFTVASITTQVLGLFQILGWELGVLEAIAGLIVVGLSMDYSIHFAHVYGEGRALGMQSRAGRVKHSMTDMGPTIVAGFLTTVAAGISLMLFSVSPFFERMGIAIFCTVVASKGKFKALLEVINRSNNCGSDLISFVKNH